MNGRIRPIAARRSTPTRSDNFRKSRFGFYRNREGIRLWGVHNRRTLPNGDLIRVKGGQPRARDVNEACRIARLREWNCIVPIPSAKPLARRLAARIARKLRVRIHDTHFKSKRISTIPVRFRRREVIRAKHSL